MFLLVLFVIVSCWWLLRMIVVVRLFIGYLRWWYCVLGRMFIGNYFRVCMIVLCLRGIFWFKMVIINRRYCFWVGIFMVLYLILGLLILSLLMWRGWGRCICLCRGLVNYVFCWCLVYGCWFWGSLFCRRNWVMFILIGCLGSWVFILWRFVWGEFWLRWLMVRLLFLSWWGICGLLVVEVVVSYLWWLVFVSLLRGWMRR